MTVAEVFAYLKGEHPIALAHSQEGHSISATTYIYDTYTGDPDQAKLVISSVTIFYVVRANDAEAKPFYTAAEAIAYFAASDSAPTPEPKA